MSNEIMWISHLSYFQRAFPVPSSEKEHNIRVQAERDETLKPSFSVKLAPVELESCEFYILASCQSSFIFSRCN